MRAIGLSFRAELPGLLRGDQGREAVERAESSRWLPYLAVIVLGAGLFGAAVGSWRAPLQSLYTALKLPLILLLTSLGNGLLNAMLAPLLGVNLSLRQSLLAVLMCFTIAAVILGAFSPLLCFLIWNTPSLAPGEATNASAHSLVLLCETGIIAFAGIAANVRLLQLLRELSGSASAARKVLFAWLAGNLLLGSQLAWNLRPFVGSPYLEVEFLRPNAFEGNFFEAVLSHATNLLSF
jgi:predicted neutral ceramidase superfamily lipid hydrolase